jgi:hypothetical protein
MPSRFARCSLANGTCNVILHQLTHACIGSTVVHFLPFRQSCRGYFVCLSLHARAGDVVAGAVA